MLDFLADRYVIKKKYLVKAVIMKMLHILIAGAQTVYNLCNYTPIYIFVTPGQWKQS